MPHLKFKDVEGHPVVLDLVADEVVIGRQAECDIIVPRQYVSRRHARVYRKGQSWLVEDLGSSHGTFVNRLRVKEKVLEAGDQILVGDEVIAFAEAAVARASAKRPEAPRKAPPSSMDDSQSETDDYDLAQIVAERLVGSGKLMRTMIGARSVDMAVLGSAQGRSVADLVVPQVPEEDDTAAGKANPDPDPDANRDTLVASHLLALVRIADELRRCTSIQAVCKTATEMAMRATRASRGVLALRDAKGRDFLPVVQLTDEGDPRIPAGPVRVSRTFVDKVVSGKVALIAQDTGSDDLVKGSLSIAVLDIRSILCSPLWDGDEIHGYLYLDNTGGRRLFRPTDLDLINAIGHHAAAEITRLKLMERIREEENRRKNFSRFLSADVIRHIDDEAKSGRLDPTQSTRESEVTILFADIQGFTTMAERMKPVEVKRCLDDYLDRMTEILVDRHGGTLDKYIGDAIMALFGAPYSLGSDVDAKCAVSAAVEMRDTMENLRRSKPEYEQVHVRIGINTGKVIAGMLGSRRKQEFSVIGDAVNVASRLESTGEPGRIQIGERTFKAVESIFECEYAGERELRNRTKPVKSWWVGRSKTKR